MNPNYSLVFTLARFVQREGFLVSIVEIDGEVMLRREPLKGCEHDAHDFKAGEQFFTVGSDLLTPGLN